MTRAQAEVALTKLHTGADRLVEDISLARLALSHDGETTPDRLKQISLRALELHRAAQDAMIELGRG